MKKLLFILSICFLTACATYSPMVNFTDYSEYSRNGMFLTESNSVNFDYQPVGSVNVLLYSGFVKAEPVKEKADKTEDAVYYSAPSVRSNYQNATIQEALNVAVKEAQDKGANAIINLKYEYIPAFKNQPSGWYISGMAIKK